MIVNIYLNGKNEINGTLVDEDTSHRLGDVIAFKDDPVQKVITEVRTSEHYDYNTVIHMNKYKDHDDSVVDDIPIIELEELEK